MSIDLHGLVAPFALDALEPMERLRFEAHLDDCEDCRHELSGYVETAGILAEAEAAPPPPALRGRLMAEVTATPQQRVIQAPAKWRMRLARGSMAAAVVVGLAGAGGYVVEHQRAQEAQTANVAMTSVLGADDAKTLAESLGGGGTVRVVYSAAEDAAVAVANLPALDDGKVYQLWMIDSVGPKSQGTFATDGTMVMHGLGDVDSVAVTVEPAGGSKLPTSLPIASVQV